jgi:hypothetical protein
MKHTLLIALLMFSPLAATAAEGAADVAEDPLGLDNQQIDEATKAMEQAAQNLINTLGLILRSIPQYELPMILPNGDILIKRVPKGEPNDTAPQQDENPDSSKI